MNGGRLHDLLNAAPRRRPRPTPQPRISESSEIVYAVERSQKVRWNWHSPENALASLLEALKDEYAGPGVHARAGESEGLRDSATSMRQCSAECENVGRGLLSSPQELLPLCGREILTLAARIEELHHDRLRSGRL